MPFVRANGHLVLRWLPDVTPYYTTKELDKLHRHLYHPSAKKLLKLLRRASPNNFPSEARRQLQDIADNCHGCQVFADRPINFQVTDGGEIRFNQELYLDLIWLDGKPSVHVIDRGTSFSGALFLDGSSLLDVWSAFLRCWSYSLVGHPRSMLTDQGSVFLAHDWSNLCTAAGITLRHMGTESHNSLG
jgi:transposase InsO family protein